MPDSIPKSWEPDPRRMGNWRSMFEQPNRGAPQVPAPPETGDASPVADVETPPLDTKEYRPWVIQRGRSQASMMLHLRRYERRSGLWMGWVLPYYSLHAVEYVGDQMLSLDFGARQFMLEGAGLNQAVDFIQQGLILAMLEYNSSIWPEISAGHNIISSIRTI